MGKTAARIAVWLLLPSLSLAADTDEGPRRREARPGLRRRQAKAIESKNWSAAIKSLSSAALRDTATPTSRITRYAYRKTPGRWISPSSTTSGRCSSIRGTAERTIRR